MNRILQAAKEALAIAKCEHDFVPTLSQPSDNRYTRQRCMRCHGTFLSPKVDPGELLRIEQPSQVSR